MKHRLIFHFLLAALCVAQAFSSVAAQTKDKPNIIVILADDLGYSSLNSRRPRFTFDEPDPH